MPTYQYSCTECGEQLEVVQSFSDPALTVCPACQGKLRKVFNSVGIVFKGSGFYRNDSRSGTNGADGADKSNAPSTDSPTTTPAKTDGASSAPAAATPAASTSSSSSTPSSSSSPKAGAASS